MNLKQKIIDVLNNAENYLRMADAHLDPYYLRSRVKVAESCRRMAQELLKSDFDARLAAGENPGVIQSASEVQAGRASAVAQTIPESPGQSADRISSTIPGPCRVRVAGK